MGIFSTIKSAIDKAATIADSPRGRIIGRAAVRSRPRPPMLRSRPVSSMNRYRPVSKAQLKYGGRQGVGRPKGPTGMYKDPKTGEPIFAYQAYALQRKMQSPTIQQQEQQPQAQVTFQQMQQMQMQRRMQQQQMPRMSNHQHEMAMRRMQIQQRQQMQNQQQAPGVRVETSLMTGQRVIRQVPPKERWLQ